MYLAARKQFTAPMKTLCGRSRMPKSRPKSEILAVEHGNWSIWRFSSIQVTLNQAQRSSGPRRQVAAEMPRPEGRRIPWGASRAQTAGAGNPAKGS